MYKINTFAYLPHEYGARLLCEDEIVVDDSFEQLAPFNPAKKLIRLVWSDSRCDSRTIPV